MRRREPPVPAPARPRQAPGGSPPRTSRRISLVEAARRASRRTRRPGRRSWGWRPRSRRAGSTSGSRRCPSPDQYPYTTPVAWRAGGARLGPARAAPPSSAARPLRSRCRRRRAPRRRLRPRARRRSTRPSASRTRSATRSAVARPRRPPREPRRRAARRAGASRRHQPGHAPAGLDRDVDDFSICVVEDGGAHGGVPAALERRRARPTAAAGATPAAHQGVGRERVAAVAAPVDGQDAQAAAGEQAARSRRRRSAPRRRPRRTAHWRGRACAHRRPLTRPRAAPRRRATM